MSATRRKVIHLTPYYPPHLGGVERVAEALARGLSLEHDVEVWTSNLGEGNGVDPAISTDGFPVHRLPAVEFAHTPLAPRLLGLLFALPENCVVHVHIAQAFWPEAVAVAAARAHFAVVAHFHLDVDPTGHAGLLLPIYKHHVLTRTLKRADAVVALTPGQAGFLAENYGVPRERVVVVPNGVDASFGRIHRSDPRTHRALRLLYVGRLDRQKNIPRLLRALAQVADPVEAVLVGDGEERARCEFVRDQLKLGDVRFTGTQYGPELMAWYEWADVFVLPSDREGMPLALLEAMAAGLAVLTTDVSDLTEQVGDAGLVVPPTEHELVGALSTLARNRPLVAALQHRSRVRGKTFSWDTAVAQLSGLYQTLSA